MPQGSSAAQGWFVKVINEVIKGLDRVAAYLDDVIVFDADPPLHVTNMKDFFLRLRKHNLKISPSKATIGATDADFLGHTISPTGTMPKAKKVDSLTKMPMPTDLKQLRSLLGGPSYYSKFLRDMAKRIRPITSLLKQGVKFVFTPALENIVRELLAEKATPPVLVYPKWDAVSENASVDGFGATLEQEQDDDHHPPHCVYQPRYYRVGTSLDPVRFGSGQHRLEHQAPSRLPGGYQFSDFCRTTRRSKASTRSQNTTREYSGG